MKAIVVSVRRFDFVADDGSSIKMSKVTCYPREKSEDSTVKGCDVFILSGTYELFDSFPDDSLPGVYDIDLRYRPDSKGRPVGYCAGVTKVEKSTA